MDNGNGSFMGGQQNMSPALQRAMQGGASPTMQPPMLSQTSQMAPTASPQTDSSMPPMPGQQPMQGTQPLPMPSMDPKDASIIIKALTGRLSTMSKLGL